MSFYTVAALVVDPLQAFNMFFVTCVLLPAYIICKNEIMENGIGCINCTACCYGCGVVPCVVVSHNMRYSEMHTSARTSFTHHYHYFSIEK